MVNLLAGPPKISMLGIYCIGDIDLKCIIPLTHTNNGMQSLILALPGILQFTKYQSNINSKGFFIENLEMVFAEINKQFQQKHEYNNNKNVKAAKQLNICLLTAQGITTSIERHIARIIKETNLEIIKVQITVSWMEYYVATLKRVIWKMNQILIFNVLSLLLDFSLRCDLVDTIIDPTQIPNARNFSLETNINFHLTCSKSRQKPIIAVFNLQPKNFVDIGGVCESVLYGIPRIMKPTSCWKMDWDELENNQSQFNALNAYMKDKSLALVLESKEIGPIHSNFLVLPSTNGTMLIKSIAVRDIMLSHASANATNDQSLDGDVKEKVWSDMNKIPVMSDYNPFNYVSNLFETALNTATNSAGSNRKKITNQTARNMEPPPKKPNVSYSNFDKPTARTMPQPASVRQIKPFSPWHAAPCVNNDDIGHVTTNDVIPPYTSAFSSASNQGKKRKPRFEPPRGYKQTKH
ncbi:meiosis 1 arrest protein-like [Clytia hemisphaerica]|uniref:meiosis 1 arrest protein-like n=1 Tax=Clytia hemisphaerica TaxID=252671 RepID=UPI0034D64826